MIHFKVYFVLGGGVKRQLLSCNKICKIYQIPIKISIKTVFNGVKKDLPKYSKMKTWCKKETTREEFDVIAVVLIE